MHKIHPLSRPDGRAIACLVAAVRNGQQTFVCNMSAFSFSSECLIQFAFIVSRLRCVIKPDAHVYCLLIGWYRIFPTTVIDGKCLFVTWDTYLIVPSVVCGVIGWETIALFQWLFQPSVVGSSSCESKPEHSYREIRQRKLVVILLNIIQSNIKHSSE